MIKKVFLILFILLSCEENNNKTEMQDMTSPPDGMTDSVNGMIFYAASSPCKAGEYSMYPTGIKTAEIECHTNGKISSLKLFEHSDENGTDLVETQEKTFWDNGNLKRWLNRDQDGSSDSSEHFFRMDGTLRKRTESYSTFNNDTNEIVLETTNLLLYARWNNSLPRPQIINRTKMCR